MDKTLRWGRSLRHAAQGRLFAMRLRAGSSLRLKNGCAQDDARFCTSHKIRQGRVVRGLPFERRNLMSNSLGKNWGQTGRSPNLHSLEKLGSVPSVPSFP